MVWRTTRTGPTLLALVGRRSLLGPIPKIICTTVQLYKNCCIVKGSVPRPPKETSLLFRWACPFGYNEHLPFSCYPRAHDGAQHILAVTSTADLESGLRHSDFDAILVRCSARSIGVHRARSRCKQGLHSRSHDHHYYCQGLHCS